MDKNMIGRNAGIVWELLTSRQHTYWSYEELKSATSLSDRELDTAIGWLVRDNTIEMDRDPRTEKERFFVSVPCYYF